MDKIVGYDGKNNYKKVDELYYQREQNIEFQKHMIQELNEIKDPLFDILEKKKFKTISDGDSSYLKFPGIKTNNLQICDRLAMVIKDNIKEVNCKYFHKNNACYFICRKN